MFILNQLKLGSCRIQNIPKDASLIQDKVEFKFCLVLVLQVDLAMLE
jgi:hypothetical protein